MNQTMNQTAKKLINQWILYAISTLIFQSFITFYVIKYFDWIHGVIIWTMVMYIAVVCGYLFTARVNHNRAISARTFMFFAIVMCLLSTSMMQWNSLWLLLLWYIVLWFGKWLYFCSQELYEFEFIDPLLRTKYAATLNTWKTGAEIVIPLVIWSFFAAIPFVDTVYLIIFIAAAVMLFVTAIAIYKLPDYVVAKLEHSHYAETIKRTSRVSIFYLTLSWLTVLIPFIWTLLEVQIIENESWVGLFQWITKWVWLLILLLILRYSHTQHPTRYFMALAFIIWVTLLLMPWWSGWVVMIIYVVVRSLLLSLYFTYEKPIKMKVLETMKSKDSTMMPIVIIQEMLAATVRVVVLSCSYFILVYMGAWSLRYWIIILTWLWFLAIAGLAFYYLYERAHGHLITNK